MIPAQVRAWAQEHLKSEIIAIEPVGGGRTDTISAVYLRDGEPVILRYVSIKRWGEIGRRHVSCEALGCRLMEGSGLPVPRLIASDPDGSRAGDYANLTTWLPGSVRLGPLSLDAIDELAKIAVLIHGTPVDDHHRPRPYEFWTPDDLEVPSWSSRPDLWQRAIDLFDQGPPPTRHGLVHRDFPLDNHARAIPASRAARRINCHDRSGSGPTVRSRIANANHLASRSCSRRWRRTATATGRTTGATCARTTSSSSTAGRRRTTSASPDPHAVAAIVRLSCPMRRARPPR